MTATLDDLRIALDPLGQAGIAVALLLIMLGVSLGLRTDDFAFLLRRRRLLAGGMAAQVVGLPLLTLLLVNLLSPPPSIALGMFVVACCPGGASSNLLTYLARGNVAYSVSLTAASSALAAALTPASILFWSTTYAPTVDLLRSLDFSPAAFLLQTALLLGVPLLVGMVLAARVPDLARWLKPKATLAGGCTLAAVVAWGIVQFLPLLAPALPLLTAIGIVHNGLAFALGQLAGRLLTADRPTRRALTFEIGIQNSGLALVILLGQLDGLGGAAAIVVFWGIWHLLAGGFIVLTMRAIDSRRGKRGL